MIIDGKMPSGKRMSVSLDDYLCALYSATLRKGVTVRADIRERIASGDIANSEQARRFVYRVIVKPGIFNKLENLEGQMDVEDL